MLRATYQIRVLRVHCAWPLGVNITISISLIKLRPFCLKSRENSGSKSLSFFYSNYSDCSVYEKQHAAPIYSDSKGSQPSLSRAKLAFFTAGAAFPPLAKSAPSLPIQACELLDRFKNFGYVPDSWEDVTFAPIFPYLTLPSSELSNCPVDG
ncbi:hypothetical protein DTL42_15175 [Bremerella cremea]|uniref:Uncharacterized protein n=1 Tax=Bremerella cremea TaxID=1031537 RepID=A0A368KRA4_9BACT|nr:hypothetical protein DTL42_15175 [Bremerella cremea]